MKSTGWLLLIILSLSQCFALAMIYSQTASLFFVVGLYIFCLPSKLAFYSWLRKNYEG